MSFIWATLLVVSIILAGVLSSLSVWYNGRMDYKSSEWTSIFAAVSAFVALILFFIYRSNVLKAVKEGVTTGAKAGVGAARNVLSPQLKTQ